MKRIISLLLIVATLFATLTINVGAAKAEEFISEVALVYEDSIEDAKKAIEGTDWKLFEQDLNANADYMIDDGVYLIYKTTTNVEEAITDLRVMDMYGGYSSANYEKQLEASRAAYIAMVQDLRIIADEFKALYEAGDEMAKLAYRQMNYYEDVKTTGGTETDMKMGDFFLNLPTDEKIVQVFMEGNSFVVYNLMALLAIGISGEDNNSLSAKIAENYAIKDTLNHEEYYDAAESLSDAFLEIRAKLLRYDALKDKYDMEDENVPEEELKFVSEYASLALLLEGIKLGETDLADLIRGGNYEIEDLYPIVASFSNGQKLLIDIGQLENVLKYNVPSKPIEELNAALDEIEKEMKDEDGNIDTIDVYMGVDRSIFKGTFAMTNAAERQQALTGKTWDMDSVKEEAKGFYIASGVLGVVDLALTGAAVGIPIRAMVLAKTAIALKATRDTVAIEGYLIASCNYTAAKHASKVYAAKYLPAAKPLAITAFALAVVIAGIVGISTWYNYYNPEYTEIPNVLVDVKETDLGDKYIKYTAAKVFEDGKLSEKNADFNAYEGKEWNALYYTKDANAGNCLTPNFVFSDSNSTVARRYQGISMFGETNAFNLNSNVFNADAKGAYVTVRYSTAKKAAASVPTVVGSIFSGGGLYVVAALGGAVVGIGGTLLLQKAAKAKKKETA